MIRVSARAACLARNFLGTASSSQGRRCVSTAPGETLLICREILTCPSPDAVSTHFQRFSARYDVLNHLTAANRIALLDPHRAAGDSVLPHLLVAERYLPPVLSQLAPRELIAYMYVSALYARPLMPRHLGQLEAALLRQLDVALVSGISPVWAAPRRGDEAQLTNIPQACFDVIRGGLLPQHSAVPLPQDVPNALWAATRARLSAPPVIASIFSELLPLLRGPDVMTLESLLRTTWACARIGCSDADVLLALTGALEKATLARPLAFAQRVLVAWALVTLHCEALPFVSGLVQGVLDPTALEAARGSLALSAQQQIAQMHTLITARRKSASTAVPLLAVPDVLPPWLWVASERHAAPVEAGNDSASLSVSVALQGLRVPHRRTYPLDGFTLDIAFPATRFGIEIVNTRPFQLSEPGPLEAVAISDDVTAAWMPEPAISTTLLRMNSAKKAYLYAKGWSLVELDWSAWRKCDTAGRERLLLRIIDAGKRLKVPRRQ